MPWSNWLEDAVLAILRVFKLGRLINNITRSFVDKLFLKGFQGLTTGNPYSIGMFLCFLWCHGVEQIPSKYACTYSMGQN